MTISGVATSLIDGMKSQPALLAVLAFNILFIGAVFMGVRAERSSHEHMVQFLIEKCAVTGEAK